MYNHILYNICNVYFIYNKIDIMYIIISIFIYI